MGRELVSNDLWTVIEPLLPPEPPKPQGGRPWVSDRQALVGILFVLLTGCPWEAIPRELGCGSPMTCWRRLRDWQRAGVWAQLHRVLLERLDGSRRLDWSRASVDSASVPAPGGRSDGPESDGPGQGWDETPCPGGWAGHPTRGDALGGERA
jgi:transposase